MALTFTLPDTDGVPVSLHEDGARAAVVVFTCNHCPYALAWHERLQDVARDYADQGVRFLQINANDAVKYPRDSLDAMRARVEAGEFAGPYLHDETQEVARAWGAKTTPDVVREVVSEEQAVAERFAGSPTIRVDGEDLFPIDDPPGLNCRVYRLAD